MGKGKHKKATPCEANWYIYFAVIISGASVLAIEILGTRIIGPFYGVSLFLWSALISVTLAALSLGYALGGQLADKGPRLSRFCALLAAAGVWIVLIPWIKHPALVLAEPFGLRFAVLFAAFVLFFPPLTLLGMVSPYAIRMKATTIDVVGRTAGNLYAVSTIASVVSAVGTGFFLIPNMGVSQLTFFVGVILIVTALAGYAATKRPRASLSIIILLALFGAASTRFAPEQKINPEEGLLAIEHSTYAEIRVIDKYSYRYLIIDGGTHTVVDPKTWKSYFPYVDVLDIAKGFFHQPGRLLLVGLGGGSVVKRFAGAGWEVDAVEIDPVVTDIAYRFFGLQASEANIFHMDGRQFLITHDNKYDIVVMDAFGSSSIPFHLVTKESFDLIGSRLSTNGILAMNIEVVGWDDPMVGSLVATLKQCYPHVLVLPIAEPPDTIGTLIILASNREFELIEKLPDPLGRFSAENRTHAWVNRFEPNIEGAPILTDERNPVDVWAERINHAARIDLHEYFWQPGLSW